MSEFAGTVVEVHGMRATVLRHDDGERVRCRPLRDRTQLAVGDRVRVEVGRHGTFVQSLGEREHCLWRPVERGKRLMAAHVDRVVVVGAVVPEARPGLFDRFLIAADAADIEGVIVLNKVDLPGREQARELLRPYLDQGFPLLETSTKTGEGLEDLRQLLWQGISVLAGHSGVGKSSLLNSLVPSSTLKVGIVNENTGRGRHTTSVTTSHTVGERWPLGGLLVDTPGVRAFGLYGFEPTEIARGFRDLRPLITGCRFRDCLHLDEPGCAVREAVEAGQIGADRYAGYTRIVESVRRGEG